MKSDRKYKKTKSLIAVLLIGLLVCGCLAGCGAGGGQDDPSQISAAQDNGAAARKAEREKKIKAAKERAAKREAEKKKKREAEKKKKEAKNSSDSDSANTSEPSDPSGSSSGEKSSSNSKSSGGSKSGSGKSSGKSSSAGSGGGGGSGGQSSSGQSKHKATCTISITCHKLVGNNDIDRATKANVPSSGVLISNMTVEIRSGDSVYDILKRACDQRGIVVAAENTGLGIYVAGIGGLYEKAAGGESGWKYKVNGTYPNDSAGDVGVSDGDVIEWVYVLEA
ncbi:MAG: DUF4430 domain-containing protein [Firmicutes bacterium]|nr:DUF4430 domain-containing protein [Bacillota bacterium]